MPDDRPEVTFQNVTITLANCENARAAYMRLCEILEVPDLEYLTQNYLVVSDENTVLEEGPTTRLWPRDDETVP